ncbi:MAG: phage tail sheath subtilisin-like domain-containing protein, partial [Roseicyclus sp.]
MAVNPTYPGVYIQKLDSGVRTVAGVPTSIAGFVGTARRGPVNRPVTCFSYADFTRAFGGLWGGSTMSYCLEDFFANGGGHAEVVRLFHPADPGGGDTGLATLNVGGLALRAKNPGAWGNALRARIDHLDAADLSAAEAAAERYGEDIATLFDLTVEDESTGAVEVFQNLVAIEAGGERRFDRVLAEASRLVEGTGAFLASGRPSLTNNVPEPEFVQAAGGNDGDPLEDADILGDRNLKTGIHALRRADIVNLICIPPQDRAGTVSPDIRTAGVALAKDLRALYIVDPEDSWDAIPETAAQTALAAQRDPAQQLLSLTDAEHAAIYFPRLRKRDRLRGGQVDTFPPCGAVAGVMARTDVQRGVWKAPAGLGATISGIAGLTVSMSDQENGLLNPIGVNCLRSFPNIGHVVWGARTGRGSDALSDDRKYVSVIRLENFI